MEIIVLFGPPGAGKGTTAETIEDFGFEHVAPGDIFRKELKEKTELGKELNKYMSKGKLVPDELVDKVVFNHLKNIESQKIVLDGFPRTVSQLNELEKRYPVNKIVDLEVSDDEIIKRLSKRRVCPECGSTYHLITKKPKEEGICDNCGSELIHRNDDKPKTIKSRLNQYRENTLPVLEKYKSLGKEIVIVDAEKSIDGMIEEAKSKLKLS